MRCLSRGRSPARMVSANGNDSGSCAATDGSRWPKGRRTRSPFGCEARVRETVEEAHDYAPPRPSFRSEMPGTGNREGLWLTLSREEIEYITDRNVFSTPPPEREVLENGLSRLEHTIRKKNADVRIATAVPRPARIS
jgi:hypothetical protein